MFVQHYMPIFYAGLHQRILILRLRWTGWVASLGSSGVPQVYYRLGARVVYLWLLIDNLPANCSIVHTAHKLASVAACAWFNHHVRLVSGSESEPRRERSHRCSRISCSSWSPGPSSWPRIEPQVVFLPLLSMWTQKRPLQQYMASPRCAASMPGQA